MPSGRPAAGQERLLIRRWHSFLGMQKKVIRQLHHMVTVSECSRQDIARDFGLQPAGIGLVHNGIDTEVFQPLPTGRAQPAAPDGHLLRRCTAQGPALPAAGLCPPVAAASGPGTAGGEQAASRRRDGTDWCSELGIADKVRFVNGITTQQMVQYYAEAAIAVVPSVYEGFGLPAGEAMACAVPVVSTDGGALPEVVGDAGVIVPARNVDALAEAIDALLRDPRRREELGARGRQRILESFAGMSAPARCSITTDRCCVQTVEFNYFPLRRGDLVLDLGCGEGRHVISAYVAADVHSVGVDLSLEDLKTTREKFSDFDEPGNTAKSFSLSPGQRPGTALRRRYLRQGHLQRGAGAHPGLPGGAARDRAGAQARRPVLRQRAAALAGKNLLGAERGLPPDTRRPSAYIPRRRIAQRDRGPGL